MKKVLKKIVLSAILVIGLVGCGNSSNFESKSISTNQKVLNIVTTEKNTYSSYSKKDESTVKNKCEECVLPYLPDCIKRSRRLLVRMDPITSCGVIAESACGCHLSKSKWINIRNKYKNNPFY